ncbi:unnamed protein product, partial [marine sediment metagenome]
MDDPLLWVAVASAALSGFFSLNAYALRDTSRRKLDPAFKGRSARRLAPLVEHLSELRMICGLLRSLCNLALLVAVLRLFEFKAGKPDIVSLLAAVGLS